MKTLRSCAKLLILGCVVWQFAASSWAQNYPTKPIRFIVPGTGAVDILGRIVGGKLAQILGQQVIVDNRPGAGGNIGAEIAASASADGYTLFAMTIAHTANATLYRKLSYDLLRDFEPVALLASTPLVVVVKPSWPVKSISDLVNLAKAKPGTMNYASAGAGRPNHLATELFKKLAGIDMVHVPYKGGGEAQTSILTGETQVYFATAGTAVALIKSGGLRALAVTTEKRVPVLSTVPTIAESGYPGYKAGSWFGLLVPAKTPKEIIATIHKATVSTLNDPDVRKRLNDLTYITDGNTPAEFGAFIRSEIATYGKLIKELGLTAN